VCHDPHATTVLVVWVNRTDESPAWSNWQARLIYKER
jgi:hypothetical protein